ncbi:hypothetical protein CRUP_035785 [Coryphaenoides rupestris]|nr:hypothetical protein CRUP_035785 [Coryphaenoides rupestris]
MWCVSCTRVGANVSRPALPGDVAPHWVHDTHLERREEGGGGGRHNTWTHEVEKAREAHWDVLRCVSCTQCRRHVSRPGPAAMPL